MRCPLALQPAWLAALMALALPLWMGCADAPAPTSLERGKQHFLASRWDDALAEFDEAIREEPENIAAYHYRGRTYAQLGQLDRAIADYDVAVRIAPDDPEAYHLRSEAYGQLGNDELSSADYRKAKQLDPLAKLLYENTPKSPQIVLDDDNADKSTSGEEKQQKQQRPRASETKFGSLDSPFDSLLDEGDNPQFATETQDGDTARPIPSLRQNLTGAAAPPVEAQSNSKVPSVVPQPDARIPGFEKVGSTIPGAAATQPGRSIAADPANDGSPPPVFEVPKQRGAGADDTPEGSVADDSRRSPGISTGVLRLAPSPIPSRRGAEKNRRPDTPSHHFKDVPADRELTLDNNPYAPANRKQAKRRASGATGTAPTLPKKNLLLSERELRSADRLNPLKRLKPYNYEKIGRDASRSKRPGSPSSDANPPASSPSNPAGATPPRIGSPGSGAIGPGAVGTDPLRSDPYRQVVPDAYSPYKITPITGNPYGSAVPNLPPIGLGRPLAPPTPFGTGGFGSSRRHDPLSGLYGTSSLLPGSSKSTSDLLRPNLGLYPAGPAGMSLRPGDSLQLPFSTGRGKTPRTQSTTAPRPRISAPHARGFRGSSSGSIKNPSPRR